MYWQAIDASFRLKFYKRFFERYFHCVEIDVSEDIDYTYLAKVTSLNLVALGMRSHTLFFPLPQCLAIPTQKHEIADISVPSIQQRWAWLLRRL